MGGGSGGSSSGDQTQTIRYAPYIETHHQDFLNLTAVQRDRLMAEKDDDDNLLSSPFYDYARAPMEIDDAFFGVGYVLSSFPALYDMFGKFMAGLDIEDLFTQILDETINNPAINAAISAHAQILGDDILEDSTPRFVTGMRDINSVMSSSFVTGKVMMEVQKTRALSRYDADVRYKMLPVAAERWKTHLAWNTQVVEAYAQYMKFWITAKMDVDNQNMGVATKDTLWPFTILEYDGKALGALQGAYSSRTTGVAGSEPSQTQKSIGGVLSGAAAGAMIGSYSANPYGVAIGAVIGGVIGLASSFA